jgi:hypothetical protein
MYDSAGKPPSPFSCFIKKPVLRCRKPPCDKLAIMNRLLFLPACLEFGWLIGIAIILLQLQAWYIPPSESRDWLMYYAMGGCAALYIGSGLVLRVCNERAIRLPRVPRRFQLFLQAFLALYGALALSWYFMLPVAVHAFAWVWLAAVVIALCWLVPLKDQYSTMGLTFLGAGLVWFLACAFAVFLSLIYGNPRIDIPLKGVAALYRIPFVAGLLYLAALLGRPYTGRLPPERRTWRALCHVLVIYALIIPVFRTDALSDHTALHHWRAFVEPAASVRAGGWLLWDTLSQYGYLQTLVIAWFPAETAWQAMYMVNGIVLTLTGYLVFAAVFATFPSPLGALLGMVLAVGSIMQPQPDGSNFFVYPSTGPLRFLWVYLMVGYVFHACRQWCFTSEKAGRPRTLWHGHAVWAAGVLWSCESAVYVTAIWLPSFVLLAMAEVRFLHQEWRFRAAARHIGMRVAALGLILIAIAGAITVYYAFALGHLPDFAMFASSLIAYTSFNVRLITFIGAIPCWLGLFFLMAYLLRLHIRASPPDARGFAVAAALYASLSSVGVVTSYYIPLSDDAHLVGNLPLLVYVSAQLLLLAPSMQVPAPARALYEKCLLCFYAVMVMAFGTHLDHAVYTRQPYLAPVAGDVTLRLEKAKPAMLDIIRKGGVPAHGHVLVLNSQFGAMEEQSCLPDVPIEPWLLPNSITGFELPLSRETYQKLAERRAARFGDEHGWVIEVRKNPLENYSWIKGAIDQYYREIRSEENGEYRIREFERLPNRL